MIKVAVGKNCVELVKYYEGFSATIYKCPAGMPTIGYGHVVWNGERFDTPITKKEAEALLRSDLIEFSKKLYPLLKEQPTQCQYDALLSMCYNTGVGKADGIKGDFADSTLMHYFNKGMIIEAGAEFNKWIYGGGRILNGLVKRRKTESTLFLTGILKFY